MRVPMIANAHIDPVRLWPRQAGVDEAIATTASMADCCGESGELVFKRGEAWLDRQIWQLTLLRSPKMAWGGIEPQCYAGRAHHSDQRVPRFALTLRRGPGVSSDAVAGTVSFNTDPAIVFDRCEGMDRPARGPVPPSGLWGTAMLGNLAAGRVTDPDPEGAGGGLFKREGEDYAG